jgi:hypothetical protein
MSLNFPTAFWKKQPEAIAVAGDISITWETGLFWSRGGNVEEGDINSPETPSSPVPPLLQSSFPFRVSVEAETLEYYSNYDEEIWVGNDNGNLPYYGWYLTGGYDQGGQNENDLSSFHRGEPWISHSSGISLWNEADNYTAAEIDQNSTRSTYNAFVQSGSATGTFNVSSAQAAEGGTGVSLYSTVSGLGEDFYPAGPAPDYNVVELYLNSTKICDGVGPQDGINVRNLSDNYDHDNYDQQQVKLYAGLDTPHDYILNPDPNNSALGAPRGYPNELVEQTTRAKYCTADGQHTFVNAGLAEGDHKIKIYSSTVDGMYSSGAFCGFEFKLV